MCRQPTPKMVKNSPGPSISTLSILWNTLYSIQVWNMPISTSSSVFQKKKRTSTEGEHFGGVTPELIGVCNLHWRVYFIPRIQTSHGASFIRSKCTTRSVRAYTISEENWKTFSMAPRCRFLAILPVCVHGDCASFRTTFWEFLGLCSLSLTT